MCFQKIARHLNQNGIKMGVLGSSRDDEIARKVSEAIDAINMTGRTSIDDVLYIIKNAMLMVCHDSISLHMASAFKVPTWQP